MDKIRRVHHGGIPARLKGLVEELLGLKDEVWVVMSKPSPCLLEFAFFQPN